MGKSVKVNLKNFGVVDIDKSISSLIKKLNDADIVTYNCCSGLWEEHPKEKNILSISDGYIMFMYTSKLWEFLNNNMSYLIEYQIFAELHLVIPANPFGTPWGNNIRLSVRGNTDEIRKLQWRAVENLFFTNV